MLRKKREVILFLAPIIGFDLKVFVIDPYKGIPRKTTNAGQPKGFLFGSPSKRFPVSPDIQDEDISFNEVEEIDEIGEDDEYDRE